MPRGPLRSSQGLLTCSKCVAPCPRHPLQEGIRGLEYDTVGRDDQACGTREGKVCWTRAWALRPVVSLAGGRPLHCQKNPFSLYPQVLGRKLLAPSLHPGRGCSEVYPGSHNGQPRWDSNPVYCSKPWAPTPTFRPQPPSSRPDPGQGPLPSTVHGSSLQQTGEQARGPRGGAALQPQVAAQTPRLRPTGLGVWILLPTPGQGCILPWGPGLLGLPRPAAHHPWAPSLLAAGA